LRACLYVDIAHRLDGSSGSFSSGALVDIPRCLARLDDRRSVDRRRRPHDHGADGWLRVTAAWSLGFFMAVGTFGWLIGGHVSNLPWAWGAEGERRTEAELRALSDEWHVEHDIADGRGNWDHIVIGPGGVFVIDSKTYHRPAELNGDELRSGRIRTRGGAFRGSAVRLKELLQQATGESTWVQAIVVVWGDFPQRVVEHDKVVYMSGNELRGWLQAQPIRLGVDARATLVGGIHTPS
jgi:hypothetical protein